MSLVIEISIIIKFPYSHQKHHHKAQQSKKKKNQQSCSQHIKSWIINIATALSIIALNENLLIIPNHHQEQTIKNVTEIAREIMQQANRPVGLP